MPRSVLRDVRRTKVSPYVTLVERRVEIDGRIEAFHSLSQADYVTVLAVAGDGRIPLVRQYRPALERDFLELPGGLLEAGEAPAVCAARELVEETGFRTTRAPRLLGQLDPDSGRLENKLWAFLATGVEPVESWRPEPGVQRILTGRSELLTSITDGRFTHALHIAIVGMALAAGAF
jgi:ADP-ribose pyrophosphatase